MKFVKTILLFPFRLIGWLLRLILAPFRWIMSKLFGPPPMTIGGPPVDHSAPEMLSETTGFKGRSCTS